MEAGTWHTVRTLLLSLAFMSTYLGGAWHPGLLVPQSFQQGLSFISGLPALGGISLNCAAMGFGEYVRGSLSSLTFELCWKLIVV